MQLSAIAFFTFAALVAIPQGEATGCKKCPIKLYDARGDAPDPFLTCVRDGKTINLCNYGLTAKDISLVYEPCNVDELESVKFRVDGEDVNCEEHEPYTINENDGDNFFPWNAPLGEIELTVSGYTSRRCRDRINKERLTFTLVEECKPDCECDDSNMCTTDTCASDGSCVFTPSVHCPNNESCDPTDGVCKADEELVPCVAVIDEDSSFGSPNQFDLWARFRATYPSRPFCLLVPVPDGYAPLVPPQNFQDEVAAGTVTLEYDVARDDGDAMAAEDWFSLCGLDKFTTANVPFVGLFVDDSGSLNVADVQASLTLFFQSAANAGLTVKNVTNPQENWIDPFLTTLV